MTILKEARNIKGWFAPRTMMTAVGLNQDDHWSAVMAAANAAPDSRHDAAQSARAFL
jgi:hypothetical protein